MAAPSTRWLLVSRPVLDSSAHGGPALLRVLIPALGPEPCDYFGDPQSPLRARDHDDGLLSVPHLPGKRGAKLLERAAMGIVLLAHSRPRQPVHLFFPPGPLTERIAAGVIATPPPSSADRPLQRVAGGLRSALGVAASALGRQNPHQRPAPVLQTLTSTNKLEACVEMLGVLDGIVALSSHTRERLVSGGIDASRVRLIYPGVAASTRRPTPALESLATRRAVFYGGELDTGAADRLIELARTLSEPTMREWKIIVAADSRRARTKREKARLSFELAGAIGAGRVELHDPSEDLGPLMRQCSIQVFSVSDDYDDLDIPLTLLEGLREGLALVTLDRPPIREVFTVAEQHGRSIGMRVDPALGPEGVIKAVHELAAQPERLLAMADDGARLVDDAFCATRMASEYAAFHDEALSGYA